MASRQALVLNTGIQQQILTTDTLVVGGGITTSTGGISVSSSAATTTLSDNVTLAANRSVTGSAGTGNFDLSALTGYFRTPTGVGTFNGSQNNFQNVVNAVGSGTGLAVTNNSTFGGTATHTGAIFANGGVDRSTAAALAVGGTNASAVNIGSNSILTTVLGNFQVNGTETVVGTTQFQNNVVFDANVTIGDGTGTDILDFNATSGRLGSSGNPNVLWLAGYNHLFAIDTAAASTNGTNLTIRGGNAGSGNQNGGNLILDAGNLTGSGAAGNVTIGAAFAANINIGTSASTTTVTGNLAQLTGTVSLAANGNSGFTTSAGTLNLQGNAAVTLTSVTSTLTLDGFTSLNFNNNGTSKLQIAGSTITIEPGVTLQSSGTGNINLPNNGSARFQVNGVSVGSTVTAAAFNTLTNGSNADALHTHSGGGGGGGTFTTTAGESIAQGAPLSLANNTGVPNAYNAQANGTGTRIAPVGLATSSASTSSSVAVQVSGTTSVPDVIWDSVPTVANVGQRVYLSENVGKLTLTPPSTLGDTLIHIGIVAVGGSSAVQVAINIGDPNVL
jgi:hypothetical protein